MTRQRLTIEADAVFVEAHNYWHVTGSDGGQTFIPAWAVTDAEPLTEPLPTEPGVRFWGQCLKRGAEAAVPQWWFVQICGDDVFYVPADGRVLPNACLDADEAARMLVRLPDPEATP